MSSDSILFLIRRGGELSRPMSGKQILEKLSSGELTGSDEIAPQNAYWFQIAEQDELRRFFPSYKPTLHQTLTNTESTQSRTQDLEEIRAELIKDKKNQIRAEQRKQVVVSGEYPKKQALALVVIFILIFWGFLWTVLWTGQG